MRLAQTCAAARLGSEIVVRDAISRITLRFIRATLAERRAFDRAMGKHEKTLQQVLLGRSDANIAFADLRNLLLALGFNERVRGDHHIFTRSGVEEIMNLQPIGAKAKPYQVRQVRNVVLRYKLELWK